MPQVPIREDGSEIVRYDFEDYPAYIRLGDLSSFPNFAAESHWHPELEFILVLDGEMLYNVNGELLELLPGDALLVNSRRFHYGFSSQNRECHYIVLLLHPLLLCASGLVEQTYVGPFLGESAPAYFLLHGKEPWEQTVTQAIRAIYACREEPGAPLRIQQGFYTLWAALYENRLQRLAPKKNPGRGEEKLVLLKDMITFIRQHYREKLTLEDIARAGYLSRNGCLALFGRVMHETPIHYLTGYRLKIAAQLLEETDQTVTEIAYQTGFAGASYFAECFRRVYGCTPLAYRKAREETR